MRVLHVIGPMGVGGAQTQLLGLVRAAHGRRWDATVCSTAPGPMLDDFRAAVGDVVELDRSTGRLGRTRQIRRIVADGEFDVVHSNLWAPNVYARLAVMARPVRPAVVISERNVEVGRSRAHRLLDRSLARWTDLWVGNSEAVCAFIREVHPVEADEVVHIPNAVDRQIFRPAPEPLRSQRPLVGSIGRLFPEKGFDVLIKAVGVLLDDGLDLELRIAGEGPLRQELATQAEGLPVRFVGQLDRGEPVADFLRSLDVFVLPSTHREGRANVLLEAISCGIPTVATDIPGTAEAVGDAASIVAPNDPGALAAGIRTMISDDFGRARAIGRAETLPDFEALALWYLTAFQSAQMQTKG